MDDSIDYNDSLTLESERLRSILTNQRDERTAQNIMEGDNNRDVLNNNSRREGLDNAELSFSRSNQGNSAQDSSFVDSSLELKFKDKKLMDGYKMLMDYLSNLDSAINSKYNECKYYKGLAETLNPTLKENSPQSTESSQNIPPAENGSLQTSDGNLCNSINIFKAKLNVFKDLIIMNYEGKKASVSKLLNKTQTEKLKKQKVNQNTGIEIREYKDNTQKSPDISHQLRKEIDSYKKVADEYKLKNQLLAKKVAEVEQELRAYKDQVKIQENKDDIKIKLKNEAIGLKDKLVSCNISGQLGQLKENLDNLDDNNNFVDELSNDITKLIEKLNELVIDDSFDNKKENNINEIDGPLTELKNNEEKLLLIELNRWKEHAKALNMEKVASNSDLRYYNDAPKSIKGIRLVDSPYPKPYLPRLNYFDILLSENQKLKQIINKYQQNITISNEDQANYKDDVIFRLEMENKAIKDHSNYLKEKNDINIEATRRDYTHYVEALEYFFGFKIQVRNNGTIKIHSPSPQQSFEFLFLPIEGSHKLALGNGRNIEEDITLKPLYQKWIKEKKSIEGFLISLRQMQLGKQFGL